MKEVGRGVKHKKHTVEESLELSVFWLHQQGITAAGWGDSTISWSGFGGATPARIGVRKVYSPSGRPGLQLSYTLPKLWTEDRVPVEYSVDLATTPCRFGGRRSWFLCPGTGCGRRVAKLYKPPMADHFLCRHCHRLTYKGRQQHRNRMHETFGKFGLYAKRLEAARGQRQRLRWLLRLLEARERLKAYNKAHQLRFLERLNRLKRGGVDRAGTP